MRTHGLIFSAFIVTPCFIAGCGPSPNAVCGPASNNQRQSHRLPVIPATWIESGTSDDANWTNPAFADTKTEYLPMHARKYSVANKQGQLKFEIDYYYSGRKYPSLSEPNSFERERVTIKYDFEAERAGKNPWRCDVSCGPHYQMGSSMDNGQVSLEEADAILKEWGISRLNY